MPKRSLCTLGLVVLDQGCVLLALHFNKVVSHRWLPLGLGSWLIALVLVGIAYFLLQETQKSWGWSLLLAGLFSNALTEIWHNGVVDYIPLHWWVINFADILIITGIAIIFLTTKKPLSTGKF